MAPAPVLPDASRKEVTVTSVHVNLSQHPPSAFTHLGKHIHQARSLFLRHGLVGTIKRLRSAPDLPDTIRSILHPAAHFLDYIRQPSTPVQIQSDPWTPGRLE